MSEKKRKRYVEHFDVNSLYKLINNKESEKFPFIECENGLYFRAAPPFYQWVALAVLFFIVDVILAIFLGVDSGWCSFFFVCFIINVVVAVFKSSLEVELIKQNAKWTLRMTRWRQSVESEINSPTILLNTDIDEFETIGWLSIHVSNHTEIADIPFTDKSVDILALIRLGKEIAEHVNLEFQVSILSRLEEVRN